MDKFTIVLNEGKHKYKISKIAFYNDGGFAFFAPYHNARQGYLYKYIVDYRLREQSVTPTEETTFAADDKVKLSFHPDGFVQFSSVNGNIISGRKEGTKEAKGLGIFIDPLHITIASGPTFGATIWGLQDFTEFEKAKTEEVVIEFNEDDYYYRDCTKNSWNSYIIESFLFKYSILPYVKEKNGMLKIEMKHFNYEHPGTEFVHRIIPEKIRGKGYVMGLLVSRTKSNFKSVSGYVLSGPAQVIDENLGVTISAQYPPEKGTLVPVKSLNYSSIVSTK